MSENGPVLKSLQIKASDEAEINKTVAQLACEGYATRVVRSDNGEFVTIEAKTMNPKLQSGFELED